MAHHEVIGFVRTDDEGAVLWASIVGYPDWVVEARVVPLDSGPVVAEVRVCPYENRRYHQMAGGPGITVGHVPVDESGQRGDPTWSGPAAAVPAGGASSRMWHRVNLGELVGLAQECYRTWAASMRATVHDHPSWADWLSEVAASAEMLGTANRQRTGRRGKIEHHLTWATRYARKVEAGSRRPISELAREHLAELGGNQEKARIYVRDAIRDARYPHGLLTQAPRGRAGGQLTDKALALLKERREQEGKN